MGGGAVIEVTGTDHWNQMLADAKTNGKVVRFLSLPF